MDTGTHLVIGFGLAGLAYVDPVVAADTATATAVLVGTVVGSQAPDFDGLLRLRGNAAYIKNHRGWSHSLSALGIWTQLITSLLALTFPGANVGHLALWVFVAVAFHVFTDLFNTYGTQALRLITDKWISWNIIHIFDPVIFTPHLAGILCRMLHFAPPDRIFVTVYALLALYYVWRTITHRKVEKALPEHDRQHEPGDRYTLIPTLQLHIWNVVKRKPDGSFWVGEFKNGKLRWVDRVTCARHPAVDASKKHPDVQAFLYFSSFACAELKEHPWGYEVRWANLRYRHRKQYPFVAVLLLSKDLEPLDSYVGWLSETRLEKKMRLDTY